MLIPVESTADPRLEPYREVKDKFLVDRGIFLAEGELVVKRLLASQRIETASVLLAEKRVEEMAPLIPQGIETFVLPGSEVSALLGFKFHSGVMAVGRIPQSPRLESLLPAGGGEAVRIVVTPEIASAENMGTIMRLSAGMGADFLLVGERCTSPWLRRTVRVSMGAAFVLPVVESLDVMRDLALLRDRGVEVVGTVLDVGSEELGSAPFGDRVALMFGSEGPGLSADEKAACTRRVTIPMRMGVDSLNVGVAAGIFMWEVFRK